MINFIKIQLVVFIFFGLKMNAQDSIYIKIDLENKIYNIIESEETKKLNDNIEFRVTYRINKERELSNLEDEIKSIANSIDYNLTFVHNKFRTNDERQLKIDFINKVTSLADFQNIARPSLDNSIEMIFYFYFLEAKKIDNVSLKENSFYYNNQSLKVFNEFHKNFKSHTRTVISRRSKKQKLKLLNLKKYFKCESTKKIIELINQLKKANKIYLVLEMENKDYELIEVSLILKEKTL